MDPQLCNNTPPPHNMAPFQVDPVEFGKISQSLEILTGEVRHMREDFKELKEDIRRKPDMSDVERKLQDYGFDDPTEIKKDAQFVRKERVKHEKHDNIKTHVTRVVITAIILGALAWIGNAALDQLKEDIYQEQTK